MIPLNLTWREIKKKLVTFEEDGDGGRGGGLLERLTL